MGISLSIICYICYVFATDGSETFGHYKAVEKTFGTGMFYLYLLFNVMSLSLFTHGVYSFKRHMIPAICDKIRSLTKKYNKEYMVYILDDWREEDLNDNLKNKIFH